MTVGAVFVDNASQMTWTDGSGYTDYETLMGEDAAEWKERNFDGEVYGSSEYWAVSVNVNTRPSGTLSNLFSEASSPLECVSTTQITLV